MADRLLGIYLNDHLGGATSGLELFRRAAAAQRGTAAAADLERLTADVAQDRESLRQLMVRLGVPQQRLKVVGGWVMEKAARLKANGRLLRRSPLSSLIELEALLLGVQGKGAGFTALREVAHRYPPLDVAELDRLVQRAAHQAEVLERLHLQAAAEVLSRS